MNNNVLVTGANGFIGLHLVKVLLQEQKINLAVTVQDTTPLSSRCKIHYVTINEDTDWSAAVKDQDVVIHTAARTELLNESNTHSLEMYRTVNVKGTINLANQAAKAGVKRFVFISSIKVNGEKTELGHPFSASDHPNPQDVYGLTKLEAEQGLLEIARRTGLEVCIIRPPLVYGLGVKGNLLALADLIAKGFPLPFLSIKNLRSFISVNNLVDLILICVDHPKAADQIFLAADGQDLSTPQLLNGISVAMKYPVRLFPCPPSVLRYGAKIIGKDHIADRLLSSLQVDITKTTLQLGWAPSVNVDDGLEQCFRNRVSPFQ